MRWLAGLALLLAALVGALVLSMGREEDGAVAPSDAGETRTRGTDVAAIGPSVDEPDGVPVAPANAESGPESAGGERAPIAPPVATIEGVVRDASGAHVPRALVGLFFPALVDDGELSPYSPQPDRPSGGYERSRLVKSWTRTDESGRFRFEGPAPRTWIVRAETGPLLAAATPPFVLEPGVSRTDLRIDLPAEAWLEGRVILPEGRTMEGLCLELRALAPYSIARWSPDPPRRRVECERAVVDEEGRFRLGPVETGLHAVGLVLDPSRRGHLDPFAGSVIPVLETYLGPGANARDIDLRAGYPGVLAVKVEVEVFDPEQPGKAWVPAELGTLTLRVEREDQPESKDGRTYTARIGEVQPCGPLAPGTWKVEARFSYLGPWSWPVASSIHLEGAGHVEIATRLRIARTNLRIVDTQAGAPFGEAILEFGVASGAGVRSWHHEIGEDGTTDLALPPGEYMVTAREEGLEELLLDPGAWARLVWDENGPRPATLRVPR